MTSMTISPMAGRTFINLSLLDSDKAWDLAFDGVNFPIYIKPLHFHHEGEEVLAEGTTNTGRDSQFLGVVIDRDRNETLSTIATVTDTYGTIPPAEVYETLQHDLKEIGVDSQPVGLYVSGDGGRQILSVEILGQKAPNCQDDITMMFQLITSIDGSKRHMMRVVAFDKTNNVELIGLTNESFNVSSRHTNTIKERHVALTTILNRMIGEWNTTIMPTMAIMLDAKFDRKAALGLMESLLKEAEMPETHLKGATQAYAAHDEEHSIYTVMAGLSSYIADSLGDKQERADFFREKLNKRARKVINKALHQMGHGSLEQQIS